MEGGKPRKTWAKPTAIPELKETSCRPEALTSAGVDPSYREYLAVLQEKNRLLKDLRKQEDQRLAAEKERERGFEVNFLGANQERLRLKEERGSNFAHSVHQNRGVGKSSATGGGRARHWQRESVCIQTERGSVVRLAPPSRQQTRESMQWLVSEEGRAWLEVNNPVRTERAPTSRTFLTRSWLARLHPGLHSRLTSHLPTPLLASGAHRSRRRRRRRRRGGAERRRPAMASTGWRAKRTAAAAGTAAAAAACRRRWRRRVSSSWQPSGSTGSLSRSAANVSRPCLVSLCSCYTHRHKDTDTDTDTHTETQTHRHTDTHRHTHRHRHTQTHRHTHSRARAHTHTHTHTI